jgi:hypothetical protein
MFISLSCLSVFFFWQATGSEEPSDLLLLPSQPNEQVEAFVDEELHPYTTATEGTDYLMSLFDR